jgi:hypothetical protein
MDTYSSGGGGTFLSTTEDDGAPHCRTISWDRTVSDGVHLYLDGSEDGTGDASGDGALTGTDTFSIGDPSSGGPVVVYRVRLDCGVALTQEQHQKLCGSLYQDPSEAYSADTELADADATYTHSGGTRCYQTAEHGATCIPGGTLGWAWDSTLDASGYGRGWPQEPGRVNRIVYSSAIDCSSWTCDSTPTIATEQVAPDGSATATSVTVTDASAIYQTASGYTNDAALDLRLWTKCNSGSLYVTDGAVGSLGDWTVDCSAVGGSWELLTDSHSAVTETTAFAAGSSGDATVYLTSDATGVTASVWIPTLTETAGLSVIPTEAAAVDTGTPAWTVDNSDGDYYDGSRGKLEMVGAWELYQPLDAYDEDYRGRTYGDGAEWVMWDAGITDASELAAGRYHNCALQTDGSLACWGYDNHGQATPPAGSDYAQVAAGLFHNCALQTDGSLACWGYDNHGQCAEAYPILQCGADLDATTGAAEWILQWDASSYVPGYSRHGVCTLGGAEQSYTIDATSSWRPATPDTIRLYRDGTVGVLHEIKIEAKP